MQQPNVGAGYYEGPNGPVKCPAEFYWREKKVSDNPPQFTKVPYFKVFLPGGDKVDRPVKEQDKVDYPQHWAHFQAEQNQDEIGWSIAQVPFLDAAQVATYKALNIKTLEGLASAPDTALQNVMGGMKHRDMARALLKQSADSQTLLKAVEEKQALEAKVDLQAAQIKELCEEIEKLKKGNKGAPRAAAGTGAS